MAIERTEQFEAVLDECCTRVSRGEPLERCLQEYPEEYREELRRLAPLAPRLGALPRDPSPSFEARLQQRLLREVDSARAAARRPWWRRLAPTRALRTATVALIVLLAIGVSGATVTQASEQSLPDSPLYTVKTAQEWVAQALARDEAAKERVNARQVDQRGRELERAVNNRKAPAVVQALVAQAVKTVDRMVGNAVAQAVAGNPQPARRALSNIAGIRQRLEALSERARPEVEPVIGNLQRYFARQEARLRRSLDEPGGGRRGLRAF